MDRREVRAKSFPLSKTGMFFTHQPQCTVVKCVLTEISPTFSLCPRSFLLVAHFCLLRSRHNVLVFILMQSAQYFKVPTSGLSLRRPFPPSESIIYSLMSFNFQITFKLIFSV